MQWPIRRCSRMAQAEHGHISSAVPFSRLETRSVLDDVDALTDGASWGKGQISSNQVCPAHRIILLRAHPMPSPDSLPIDKSSRPSPQQPTLFTGLSLDTAKRCDAFRKEG